MIVNNYLKNLILELGIMGSEMLGHEGEGPVSLTSSY
jgi:hypothetical protein